MAITTQKLQDEVRDLVAKIAELDVEKVAPDASFVDDLGMDSMMALEILASIEKKYKVKIPEENLTKITSLNQVVALVADFLIR